MSPSASSLSAIVAFIFINKLGLCDENKPDFAPVYLTLSSLYREATHSTTLIDREIQIHWTNGSLDTIALYNQAPNPTVEPILQFKTVRYPSCFLETNIPFGNPTFPNGWERGSEALPLDGDHCLPMWVVGYKAGEIVHSDCLKIRPTWMHDIRLSLESMNITSAFIPGTHNSGCYKRGETLSQRDTSGGYILTQDQSLWNQLVYGIRYLDFRIGYYSSFKNSSEPESDNNFWINHDLIRVRQLASLLEDIKAFLKKTKDEILIIDFHRFPLGFSGRPKRHYQLVRLLQRELEELAYPYEKGSVPTFGNIWESGKRIIISYGENSIAQEFSWLWPPIRQLWGDKQAVSSLYIFLESCMKNDSLREARRGLWAAMAQLTPTPLDLLYKPKGSLRNLAHEVNKELTAWCRNNWWDRANVMAMDFFLGTDVINTALTANVFKGNKAKQYLVD